MQSSTIVDVSQRRRPRGKVHRKVQYGPYTGIWYRYIFNLMTTTKLDALAAERWTKWCRNACDIAC